MKIPQHPHKMAGPSPFIVEVDLTKTLTPLPEFFMIGRMASCGGFDASKDEADIVAALKIKDCRDDGWLSYDRREDAQRVADELQKRRPIDPPWFVVGSEDR